MNVSKFCVQVKRLSCPLLYIEGLTIHAVFLRLQVLVNGIVSEFAVTLNEAIACRTMMIPCNSSRSGTALRSFRFH
jgi:hypothetical protein